MTPQRSWSASCLRSMAKTSLSAMFAWIDSTCRLGTGPISRAQFLPSGSMLPAKLIKRTCWCFLGTQSSMPFGLQSSMVLIVASWPYQTCLHPTCTEINTIKHTMLHIVLQLISNYKILIWQKFGGNAPTLDQLNLQILYVCSMRVLHTKPNGQILLQ